MDYTDTFSGKRIFPFAPEVEQISILDIAHALSNICRFGGHTKEFYSVAQHSILVSQHCDPTDALWGLLHDASEAYIGDLTKPIKQLEELKPYRDAEDRLHRVISIKFKLSETIPESVKRADKVMLMTEKRDLMKAADLRVKQNIDIKPLPKRIIPLPPKTSEQLFMERFNSLMSLAETAHPQFGG
ncbi:MAG: phosphohydrolase [Candidatus Doudnabacteria bacterium]|nr:phosphohydrolase [Candidatus Doudnabacteria bacterium]